jgi:hypothetical protein
MLRLFGLVVFISLSLYLTGQSNESMPGAGNRENNPGILPVLLQEIHAPVLVGRPTDNAFNGLVQLPDGELRHYGSEGSWNSPSVHVYSYSQDMGRCVH